MSLAPSDAKLISVLYIMRFLGLCILVFFTAACQSPAPQKSVSIAFEHIEADSCTFQLLHMISGKVIYKESLVSLKGKITLDSLKDDMYLAVISWPKTYLSDTVYNKRLLDKAGSDLFELTKPIYINKQQDTAYTIFSSRIKEKAYLELNGSDSLFIRSNSPDGLLADEFWELYNDFFDRKELLLDSLKQVHHAYIDRNNLKAAKEAYTAIEVVETAHFRDDKLDADIIAKIQNNLSSPVSTYFLFYQLYHYRAFGKYSAPFLQLKGRATASEYYRMVKKQYDI